VKSPIKREEYVMETQFYFWIPLIERHKKELSILSDYYSKTKIYFDDINKQAREHGNKLFREYRGTEDTDYSAVAEWAEEESVEMYQTLYTMKSNHLLMTISLLYHTWEQQLIKFTIKELEHYFKFTKKVLAFKEAQTIFRLHGVSITETASWVKIRELKFLTNTIKHGDGISADKLRKIRPDLFQSDFADHSFDTLDFHGAVLLEGYTLKVKESDLLSYVDATKSFWDEMPERAFSDTEAIMNELKKQ
jgi:hypothetical protein